VFGHSHVPLHEERRGFQIFNPGSPTDKRRQPRFTMGIGEVEGRRIRFRLVPLD
jgi:predicted phosphodiesterase